MAIKRDYHRWYSSRLGHDMVVLSYGHWGAPLLAFPTSGGDEWEYENQSMVETLGQFIDGGRLKFFAVGQVSGESFYNKSAHPFIAARSGAVRRVHSLRSRSLHLG